METFGARTFHEVTSKPLRGKEVGIIEIPTCYPEKNCIVPGYKSSDGIMK